MSARNVRRALWRPVAAAALAATLQIPSDAGAAAANQMRADLEVVDCILPGQVRQLGNRTYMTQRRPTRTTASDCRIRGGEYVAYDRADLKSSLAVWMPAAQAGDPEAQTNVGEIFESGVGTAPDYEAAALWYTKAAPDPPDPAKKQKPYARALYNLGTLYEEGKGVAQDRRHALNLYREALGIKDDNLLFQSQADADTERLREELTKQLQQKNDDLNDLKKQLQELERKLSGQASESAELARMRRVVAQLDTDKKATAERLGGLPQSTRGTGTLAPVQPQIELSSGGVEYGRYFALIIGNQRYDAIPSLKTPHSDAERLARTLKDKYGFSVQLLEDADDVQMLRALNDFNAILKPNDNLLVYYAGHGSRLRSAQAEVGYWLPKNAEPLPETTFWVQNEQITAHLGRLPARRVLVIADSCYAGLLSSDPGFLTLDQAGPVSAEYVRIKLPNRSRMLIASGGDEPVLDSDGAENSVFARSLTEVLESNQRIMPAFQLFAQVRARMQSALARSSVVQHPEFKSIKSAGHELGDFFFVPRSST